MAGQNGVPSIVREFFCLEPGGPAQPWGVIAHLPQTTRGNRRCLEHKLYIEVTFLANKIARELYKRSKGVPGRQELTKRRKRQRAHAQRELRLLVPNATAEYCVHPQGIVRLAGTKSRAVFQGKEKPLSCQLDDFDWYPKIIL
jgi:hypothetical protein